MTFYETFTRLIEAKGITAYRVAKDLGISRSAITKWKVRGSTPTGKMLRDIADYLDVTTDYLLSQIEVEREVKSVIPILGTVPCGVPIECVEDILGYIETTPSYVQEKFGLVAHGDSMDPYIMDGDILVVHKMESVENGKIAIVKINGDEATCKKVLIKDNGIVLVPLNSNYEPQFFTETDIENLPVQIVGEVEEIRRTLK